MNDSKRRMIPPLLRLLVACDEVSTAHGIPLEVCLVTQLSLGAAMAGDLIEFNGGDGQRRNAKLSLLLITGDVDVPLHFKAETEELFRRQAQVVGKATSPFQNARINAELRRKVRAASFFETTPGLGTLALKSMIAFNKRRKSLGAFTTVAERPTSAGTHSRTTIIADSSAEVRKILKSACQENGWWQALTAARNPVELIACLPELRWRQVARLPDAKILLGRVWAISCPESSFEEEAGIPTKLMCGEAFKRLEYARFGSAVLRFISPAEVRELLDLSVEQFRAMDTELLSLSGYEAALPDPYLAWKFSSILTAMCCEGTGEELRAVFIQCTELGCALASWVLHQHVSHLRSYFPHIQGREIAPVDRRVLRALTSVPAPVRSIQRRLKAVSKAVCLDSLGRLLGAKLAIETRPGHFASPKGPTHSHELSTFLSTFHAKQIFPLTPMPDSTANTDKTARTEKREILPHH